MSADSSRPGERRHADRRRSGRRAEDTTRKPVEESWFGALGVGSDTQMQAWVDEPESRFAAGFSGQEAVADDSRFLSRQARRIMFYGVHALPRIYRAFVAARAALGCVLVMVLAAVGLIGARMPLPLALVSVAYAAQAVSLWVLPRFRRAGHEPGMSRLQRSQWLATIGVDLVAFSTLHVLDPTSSLNYVALFVLPVLMAGVLTSRLGALATAAIVALVLLASAWHAVLAGGDAAILMTQAGLAGSGFFVITLLAGELAGRLAREELTARGSLELARQQAQLNRLVIEEMQDGVLVVDRRGRVRAANPAARALLVAEGLARLAPFQLQGHAAWGPLLTASERAFAEGHWPEAGRDLKLHFDGGTSRTLRVRARFTRRRETERQRESGEEFCVLFLEDLRSVQSRMRQEKLAAMGRVSAGIAHEIRNPLAAIAQANALMQEDELTVTHQQLTKMVADNVERLKRLVDDVMEVAPGAAPAPRVIDVTSAVSSTCADWARTTQMALDARSRLRVELPGESLGVVFDAEHLRRVLVNLLDNARRHASDKPGAIRLSLGPREDGSVMLTVASDGDPIPPDVERYLFEPFFSTRSRGTGLGLYICKELCERYGASIDYRLRPAGETNRNEFHVIMQRGTLLATDIRLHLAT
jgi:two-component system sensor histidine kinase PilS (NtrC family)